MEMSLHRTSVGLFLYIVSALYAVADAGGAGFSAQDSDDPVQQTSPGGSGKKFSYVPVFHATLRPRYEAEINDYEGRFAMRNARLSVEGRVCPVIDYKLQADFCDRGKFKMLDAWVGLALSGQFKLIAGQTLIPFSVDGIRSPHNYYFANRSFAGDAVGSNRGVGAKVGYAPASVPLTIEAGLFNNATISDHDVWEKDPAFAAKARYVVGNLGIEGGFKTAAPDSVRINFVNGVVSWSTARWIIEGEYIYKHYTNYAFKPSHAYSGFASYWMPVNAGIFNRLSFQGRWDGMTDHSSGARDKNGHLYLTDNARNRLTVGSTISYVQSKVKADIRFNYEKYFYHHGVDSPQGGSDKIVVELALRF